MHRSVGLLLWLLACGESTMVDAGPEAGTDATTDASRDAAIDSTVDATSDVATDAAVPLTGAVDLLIMMDNSGSMSQEQVAMARELPRLVRGLATGDVDGDGTAEFDPVESLNVGVVTSDMGTGTVTVPGPCSESGRLGDDGILRNEGTPFIPDCPTMLDPRYLSFAPGSVDPADFAADVECLTIVGTNGCGIEQQMEAVLKAVTPASSDLRFNLDSLGHGDTLNAGFLRPGSVLVVLLVTDEDDCSILDPRLFERPSERYPDSNLNLRCFYYPEGVHPIGRFVDGLLAVRVPGRVVFGAISGIPEDVNPVAGEPINYATILAHPDMQERANPMMPQELAPSCNRPGTGVAFPPRRILSAAQQLELRGARTAVQTICQDSYAGAVELLLTQIGAALSD